MLNDTACREWIDSKSRVCEKPDKYEDTYGNPRYKQTTETRHQTKNLVTIAKKSDQQSREELDKKDVWHATAKQKHLPANNLKTLTDRAVWGGAWYFMFCKLNLPPNHSRSL